MTKHMLNMLNVVVAALISLQVIGNVSYSSYYADGRLHLPQSIQQQQQQRRLQPQTNSSMQWSPVGNVVTGTSMASRESDFRVGLSADGRTIAIGMPTANGTAGRVRIVQQGPDNHSWVQLGADILGELSVSGLGSYAGYSVALSETGTVVAVGFPGDVASRNYPQHDSHVRVYVWDETRQDWFQRGSDLFKSSQVNKTSPHAGFSVSISNDGAIVAVGAPKSIVPKNTGLPGQVRTYLYDEQFGDWQQLGQAITGDINLERVRAGFAVSLSGDGSTLAMGAPQISFWAGTQPISGYAEVYQLMNSTTPARWRQVGSRLEGDAPGAMAGYSVSLSTDGKTLAVGHPSAGFGLVRAYMLNDNKDWVQQGQDIVHDEETGFGDGRTVSLSGDGSTLAVAAPARSVQCVTVGLARIFRLNNSSWEQVGATLPGEERTWSSSSGDRFGTELVSLSSDGNRLVVGAPLHYTCEMLDFSCEAPCSNPDWTGHVQVFDLEQIAATAPPTQDPSWAPTAAPSDSLASLAPSELPITQVPTESPTGVPFTLPSVVATTSLPTASTTLLPTPNVGLTESPSESPALVVTTNATTSQGTSNSPHSNGTRRVLVVVLSSVASLLLAVH